MKNKIILGLLILFSINAFSQRVEDDFSEALGEDGRTFLRFDTKNSFISNSKVKIFGLNLGYNHNNTVKYGIGLHSLISPIDRVFYVQKDSMVEEVQTNLKFTYVSFFGEYVFYKNNNWEGSLPIQVGFGGTKFTGVNNDSTYVFHNKFTMHYEATLVGHYRFLKYFAIGGGIGYRIMLINNKNLGLQLTNPIYTIKFKFFIGDLYKDTKTLFVKNT